MTLESFLNTLTQIIFLVVGGSTLFNWVKKRDRARRDTALVFIVLAITIILQALQRVFPAYSRPLGILVFLALLAHPYFLLRVAHYFRPLSSRVQRLSSILLLLAYASLVFSAVATIVVTIALVAYFVIAEGYVAFLFVQGARTLTGISRRRLRLASAGCGLLALAFLSVLLIYSISLTALNAKVALDGRLLFVNKIATQASGLPPDELLRTNFLEGPWWAFDPEVQSRVKESFAQACAGVQIGYDENIYVFGQVQTIRFSLTPVFGDNGRVEYIRFV